MIRVISIFLVLIVCVLPACAEEKDPNPFNMPDSVMALPRKLHAGQPFMGYPELKPQIKWFAIPPWLAGTWKSNEQRLTRTVDYESGAWYTIPKVEAAVHEVTFGDLKDADGQQWYALISPEIFDYQKDRFIDTQNTISVKMLECSAEHVMIWSRTFHILYNPAGRQIANSYTEESVCDYQPTTSGRLMCNKYARLYDAYGDLKMSAYILRTYVLTKQFGQNNVRAGIELIPSLTSHLQYIGRHDLIAW